ncbi:MAG TPA: hypothetical protein VMM13_13420, partial [Euzebya sp.]|nr:hypothetical protein [Euzebya sp.]
PGVPDIYRGTEIWDSSLVDPDNRRALRTDQLRAVSDQLQDAVGGPLAGVDPSSASDRTRQVTGLREGWRDGLVKLLLTREGLHLRRAHPAVFGHGPLGIPQVVGARADHVAALRRGGPPDAPTGRATVITVATRLPHTLAGGAWPIGAVWQDTRVQAGGGHYLDVLTGVVHQPVNGALEIGQVLATLPVAMLVGDV